MASEGGLSNPDDDLVKDLLKKEKDALITRSLKEIKVFGDRLAHGEITQEQYQHEVDEIKKKIAAFEEQIRDLKAPEEPPAVNSGGRFGQTAASSGASAAAGAPKDVAAPAKPLPMPPAARKATAKVFNEAFDSGRKQVLPPKLAGYLKLAAVALIILAIPVYIYLSYTCLYVSPSTKAFKIMSLLGMIAEKSPSDYEMVCGHSSRISYLYNSAPASSGDGSILLDSRLLDSDRDEQSAAVIVYDGCLNMLPTLTSQMQGLAETDAQTLCVRRMYLFLLHAGYYRTYDEMAIASREGEVQARLSSSDGVPLTMRSDHGVITNSRGSEKVYCSSSNIKVDVAGSRSSTKMKFTNLGASPLPCGLIELSSDGQDIPLDCGELNPGKSYTTGPEVTDEPSQYSVRIMGCKDELI